MRFVKGLDSFAFERINYSEKNARCESGKKMDTEENKADFYGGKHSYSHSTYYKRRSTVVAEGKHVRCFFLRELLFFDERGTCDRTYGISACKTQDESVCGGTSDGEKNGHKAFRQRCEIIGKTKIGYKLGGCVKREK